MVALLWPGGAAGKVEGEKPADVGNFCGSYETNPAACSSVWLVLWGWGGSGGDGGGGGWGGGEGDAAD